MIMDSDRCFNEFTCEHRRRVREVYKTEAGQNELFNLMNDLGLFKAIGPDELDRRDYAIYKLEEIGMLDESVIRRLIAWFFNSDPDMDEKMRLASKFEKKQIAEGHDPFSIKETKNG